VDIKIETKGRQAFVETAILFEPLVVIALSFSCIGDFIPLGSDPVPFKTNAVP
jgi:hypothetical protein